MPYSTPKKSGLGYVLPEKDGGLHKSGNGKVVHFKTRAGAERVARYINTIEHKTAPTKQRTQRYR